MAPILTLDMFKIPTEPLSPTERSVGGQFVLTVRRIFWLALFGIVVFLACALVWGMATYPGFLLGLILGVSLMLISRFVLARRLRVVFTACDVMAGASRPDRLAGLASEATAEHIEAQDEPAQQAEAMD